MTCVRRRWPPATTSFLRAPGGACAQHSAKAAPDRQRPPKTGGRANREAVVPGLQKSLRPLRTHSRTSVSKTRFSEPGIAHLIRSCLNDLASACKTRHSGDKIVWSDVEQLEAGPDGASPRDGATNNRSVQGNTF
jgi:hypothetical protein